jgi:hypothetical protein
MTDCVYTDPDLGLMVSMLAEARVGKAYDYECGDFVREILSQAKIQVGVRLRDHGTEISPVRREPGDLVFYYSDVHSYERNEPSGVAIVTNLIEVVRMTSGMIVIDSYVPKIVGNLSKVRRTT